VRNELVSFGGVLPCDPPEGFTGTLRGYQKEGLGWIHFLEKFGFGDAWRTTWACKTVVLAMLAERRETDRPRHGKRAGKNRSTGMEFRALLVVSPKSLV
jgi:hypothetical protein